MIDPPPDYVLTWAKAQVVKLDNAGKIPAKRGLCYSELAALLACAFQTGYQHARETDTRIDNVRKTMQALLSSDGYAGK